MYLISFNLFNKLRNLPNFDKLYHSDYKNYIIENINPGIILKDMIYSSNSSRDIIELLKFFEIEYTENYFESLDLEKSGNKEENISLRINN
tara:strand:- start:337 stop:609 length:273 start_codon:yes stop_codon:yes gene_type:complete